MDGLECHNPLLSHSDCPAPSQAWSLEALHDRHGTAVRIGPNHISWTSCEAMNAIYSHGGNFDKSHFYRSFQVYAQHPSIFSDIDPASHADRRRSVSAAYSMKSLVGLEQCVDPLIESLVGELRARCRRSDGQAGVTQVDMAMWMHYFAMDAVGELAVSGKQGPRAWTHCSLRLAVWKVIWVCASG